jgi:uncharacterized membrane protein
VNSHRWSAVILLVAAIACAVLNTRSSVWAIQISTALPLVLYLPGAALVLAVDPWRRRVKGPERLLWSLLGSIGSAIGGGLILNVASELNRTTWLAYLLAVTIAAAVATTLRGGSRDGPALSWGARLRKARAPMPTVLLIIGASTLVAAAVALSVYSSSTSNRERFVQLWILPNPAGAGATAVRAEVGVTNYEGRRLRFDVSIETPKSVLLSRQQVVLGQGQTWTYHLIRKGQLPVLATVSLASQPSRVLDSVRLASPVK